MEGIHGGGGFVAAVHHAVLAFGVFAFVAVEGPVGVFGEFFEGVDVAFVEQVAGFLPAEDAVAGATPGGAFVVFFAGEEVEEEGVVVKLPFGFAEFVGFEDLAEEGAGLVAFEEVGLVGCPVVAVAGGDLHPVDAEFGEEGEEFLQFDRVCALEDGGVGIDLEAFEFGGFDGADGFVEDATAIDAFIMPLAHSVEVDHEGEVGGGSEFVETFFEEESVGAEVDEFFAIDQSSDDFADLGVEEGFTARDRDDGGTAFFDSGEAFFGGEVLLEDLGGVLDFAAAGAGEVTAKEGL